MGETSFQLAGAELPWPIGSAAGLTNHPDIGVVGHRLEDITSTGISFATGGSWTLGEQSSGNSYVKTEGGWEYVGGDEHVDPDIGAGYNAKRLPNPGTDIGMNHLSDLVDLAAARNVELALSLSPHGGKPLEELREIMSLAGRALAEKVLYVEINLSCPNVPDRPAFYLDEESVLQFFDLVGEQDPLLNKYEYPGVYFKFGPFEPGASQPTTYLGRIAHQYGIVTSNTLGNQVPLLPDGQQAIKVNNGKAGMSGPALKELGRDQLSMWAAARSQSKNPDQRTKTELISVLGAESGQELKIRRGIGATAVQFGSILYWPDELGGWESAAEAVKAIKKGFLEAA